MKTRTPRDRLVFALDFPSLAEARDAAAALAPHVGVLKVGLEGGNLRMLDYFRPFNWLQLAIGGFDASGVRPP